MTTRELAKRKTRSSPARRGSGGQHRKSSNTNTAPGETWPTKPIRYKSDFKIHWSEWIIPASAITTGFLVGFAAPQLLQGDGVLAVIKAMALGTAAGFVSWTVNHHAIKHGTDLAASGVKTGAIVSLAAITITGGAAFAFSYSGITLNQVNALAYDEHGQALATYIEETNAYAAQVTQTQPVIASIARDIETKLDCEITEGCLSGKGGGKGATYRSVLAPTERARNIAQQLEATDAVRSENLSVSNELLAAYQTAQSEANAYGAATYRQTLSGLDGAIKQQVATLREATPITLIRAYELELRSGLSIEGHPEGTRVVNALLDSHADSIALALSEIEETLPESPAFPGRAGVSDAFDRFAHFWPIGILTAAIELIIPLTLWWLAYAGLVLKLYRQEHAADENQKAG